MAEPKKYILVGCGGFGMYWCRSFLPPLAATGRARAVAAVDINPQMLPNAIQHLGLPAEKCYTDVACAMDENQADFVIIVVPPAHHESVVDAALAHGLNILSEKPIADTMEACARIYKKVTASGRKMAVTMSHRFDQDKQSLQRRIASGKYGRLDYLVGRNTWNFRERGTWGEFRYDIADPLLIEGTVHHFDIIRSLAGSNARTVHAMTWNPAWSQFKGDCQGLILLEMENGVRALYEGAKANASALNDWGQDYFRAECENATLELDRRQLRCIRRRRGFDSDVEEIPLDKQPSWTHQWLAEMFVDWLNGGPEPASSLRDNIQCAALLFAAIESAHSGRVVDVQEFLGRYMG